MANPKSLLNNATRALNKGQLDVAEDLSRQVVEKFPDTLASDSAQKILELVARKKTGVPRKEISDETRPLSDDRNCSSCGLRILGTPAKCPNCGTETGLSRPPANRSQDRSRKTATTTNRRRSEAAVTPEKEIIEPSQTTNAGDVHRRICDYCVIRKKYEHELVAEVKNKMNYGWVPWGGVSYVSAGMSPVGNIGNTFIQAMVKLRP